MKIECSHLTPLEGCDTIRKLMEKKLLTLDGSVVPNFICDHQIPVDIRGAQGQSVACVGNENTLCPDQEDKL